MIGLGHEDVLELALRGHWIAVIGFGHEDGLELPLRDHWIAVIGLDQKKAELLYLILELGKLSWREFLVGYHCPAGNKPGS